MTKLSSLSYAPRFTGDARTAEQAKAPHKQWADADVRKLKKACAEFESLFINLVMKQMRKTVAKSGLIDGGKGEQVFTEMMDEEISKQIALRQGIGLKDAMIEQLTGERVKVLPHQSGVRAYEKHHAMRKDQPLLELSFSGSISSPYGWRTDPFTGERDFHQGIDLAKPFGSEITAAGEGTVIYSGWKKGYGQIVEIEHSNGISTLYAHNSRNLVRAGERVSKHQPIALVGDSGRSTGPHLHFEVREDGKAVNPSKLTRINQERRYAQSL
jgi:murein DD-endopeptidase MepM/ murein hydrolase activator NlpD